MQNAKQLLDQYNVSKDNPLIVSVSGGVDSMALLDYLHEEKYQLFVVHFNHNTRDSNISDEKLVIDYCKTNKIKHQIISISVKSGNFQETARNMRYYNLREIARKYRTPYILTAHHLDDLVETVLIKLTRGSNLYGYAGIHPFYEKDNFFYLKPLLYTNKDEIISYAKEHNVPYLDDFTNFENTYLRNRYRHAVIPILKQENPQFLEQIKRYHLMLAKASSFTRDYSSKFIDSGNKIAIDNLLKEDIYVVENAIAILLEVSRVNFTYDTTLKLVKLLKSDEPNLSYDLSGNKTFIKAYNEAFIIDKKASLTIKQNLDKGVNKLINMKIITLLDERDLNSKESIKLCYNKLKFPLVVRTRENGDLLSFDYGSKKLKDLLIDLKIPKHLRDELLIVTDSNNTILWIPDVYLNKTLGSDKQLYLGIGDNHDQ